MYAVTVMRKTTARAFATAILLLSIAGCSREQESSSEQQQGNPAVASAPVPELNALTESKAPALPPATELRIESIRSVMVRRPADAPAAIVIRASGNVASAGWSGARLTPVEDDKAAENVRVYSFVATSPETSNGEAAPQTVQTELRVEGVPPEVRTIRIVSSTNTISAPIVQ
jgi:hypothetical protein